MSGKNRRINGLRQREVAKLRADDWNKKKPFEVVVGDKFTEAEAIQIMQRDFFAGANYPNFLYCAIDAAGKVTPVQTPCSLKEENLPTGEPLAAQSLLIKGHYFVRHRNFKPTEPLLAALKFQLGLAGIHQSDLQYFFDYPEKIRTGHPTANLLLTLDGWTRDSRVFRQESGRFFEFAIMDKNTFLAVATQNSTEETFSKDSKIQITQDLFIPA